MCGHNWYRVNDVLVCLKCGLTKVRDTKTMFDKAIVNYRPKRRKKK